MIGNPKLPFFFLISWLGLIVEVLLSCILSSASVSARCSVDSCVIFQSWPCVSGLGLARVHPAAAVMA
ncbi:MAG: hypothetical protein M3P70_04055 [Actinomycetota bacterium]|nr:hypothetical protein [Actinomycetota bacterium]